MKLYRFPGSTACAPVEFFCADAGIEYEPVVVDILAGKQYEPPYADVNPTGVVPTLVDGDLVLGESSAILKYLADKVGSPAYPRDLKQRAKVNELMDWFNTQFYREWGYHFIYGQTLDHIKLDSEQGTREMVARGRAQAARLLGVLDRAILGDGRRYLCGDQITIADFFGAAILGIRVWIGQELSAFPNVDRWFREVTSRPSYAGVGRDLANLAGFFAAGSYSKIGAETGAS